MAVAAEEEEREGRKDESILVADEKRTQMKL